MALSSERIYVSVPLSTKGKSCRKIRFQCAACKPDRWPSDALDIEIRIVTTDEAVALDFSMIDPCPHCRLQKRKTEGFVFWDGQLPLPVEWSWAIIFTGKCDVCHSFAFWCWDCGSKVVVPDDESYECGREHTWFVEKSDDEAVFVIRMADGEVPMDRRALR